MQKPELDHRLDDDEFESFAHSSVSTIDRKDVQWLSMTLAILVIGTCSLKWFLAKSDHEPTAASSAAAESQTGFKVDLNRASVDELSLLPQVGPKLAANIVAEREQRGRFLSIDDLKRTSGIGPERIAQLGPLLEIND